MYHVSSFYEEIKLSLSVPTLYPKPRLWDKIFIFFFGLTLFSHVSVTNSCCGGCVNSWSEHFHAIYLLHIWCLKGLQLHFCGLSCEQSMTQALISIIGNTCISSTISSHNGSCEKDRLGLFNSSCFFCFCSSELNSSVNSESAMMMVVLSCNTWQALPQIGPVIWKEIKMGGYEASDKGICQHVNIRCWLGGLTHWCCFKVQKILTSMISQLLVCVRNGWK